MTSPQLQYLTDGGLWVKVYFTTPCSVSSQFCQLQQRYFVGLQSLVVTHQHAVELRHIDYAISSSPWLTARSNGVPREIGETTLRINSGTCCGKTTLRINSGTCCGKTTLRIDSRTCCGKTTLRIDSRTCCGKTTLRIDSGTCCGKTTLRINSGTCCGKTILRVNSRRCCQCGLVKCISTRLQS